MSDRIRLTVDKARTLCEHALAGLGYDAEEARIIADHVIDAALCGYEYSGLAKILNIPEHRRFREPRRPIRVVRESAVSALYDGGNNVGMLVMYHAARAAIAKAAQSGFAVLAVTNSWMSGRSAYYVEMIARADLVAIHTAAAAPAGAPPVFDMGTSAFMMTDLALRERMGRLLPEGVAIDAVGRPTRDPAAARQGALLPFGGYKGFGLALVVAALGQLAGSGAEDDGYLFVVFKPDLLIPLESYKQQVGKLVDRIKSTPRLPGVDDIRIPGERAFRCRERALAEGLEIDRLVYDRLRALSPWAASGGNGREGRGRLFRGGGRKQPACDPSLRSYSKARPAISAARSCGEPSAAGTQAGGLNFKGMTIRPAAMAMIPAVPMAKEKPCLVIRIADRMPP